MIRKPISNETGKEGDAECATRDTARLPINSGNAAPKSNPESAVSMTISNEAVEAARQIHGVVKRDNPAKQALLKETATIIQSAITRVCAERDETNERIAVIQAHRACHSAEHDPQNGKIHGYCVVCGVPFPCEYIGKSIKNPLSAQLAVMKEALEKIRDTAIAMCDVPKRINSVLLIEGPKRIKEQANAALSNFPAAAPKDSGEAK